MVKQEQDVGKAGVTAAKLFDPKLYHVLTVVLNLELDSIHSKYRDILSNNNIRNWDDFDENGIDEVKTFQYTDQQGNVNEFW